MADQENPPVTSFLNRYLPSYPCCCTNHRGRSSCTNCPGNHCQNTRAANYHTLTARISELASKRFENFNDRSSHETSGRHSTYCLDDYLTNSQEKENSCSVSPTAPAAPAAPTSPVLSPDTVDVLQNAERLVKDAQRQIMEVSYKTHLGPIQENGTGCTSRPPLDDNLLYLHELVAAKFQEANASNRNSRQIPSASLADVRPKELSKLQDDQIPVKESQSFLMKKYELQSDKHSESSIRNERAKPMAKEEDKFFQRFQADCTTTVDVLPATMLPPRHQAELGISSKSSKSSDRNPQDSNTGVFRVNEGDQRARTKCQIQKGPQVDIQRGLTIQSVDNIHISPDPSSVPVYRNVATYEFQHESIGNKNPQESKISSAKFIDIYQQPSSPRVKDCDAAMLGDKPLDQVDAEEHVEAVEASEENIIPNPSIKHLVDVSSEEIEIPQKEMESNLNVTESRAANDDRVTNVSLQFHNQEMAPKSNEKDETLIKEIKRQVSPKNTFHSQDPLRNEEFELDNINLQPPKTVDLDRILQVYSRSIANIVRGTQKLSQLLEQRTSLQIPGDQGKLYSNENYILPPSTGTLMTSLNLANPLSQFKYPQTTMNVECVKNSVLKKNTDDRHLETCAMQNPSTRSTAIITKNVTENINESYQAIAKSDSDQGPLDVTANRNFVLTVHDSIKSNVNIKPWSVPIVISSDEKSMITSTRNDIRLESSDSTQYAKYDVTSEEEDKFESKGILEKSILIKQGPEKPSEDLLSEFSSHLDKLLHVDSSFRRELKSNTGSSYNIHSDDNAEFATDASSLLTSFRKPKSQDTNANAKHKLASTPEGAADEDDQAHMVKQVFEAPKHSSKAMEEFVTWLLAKRESNIAQDVTSVLHRATINPLITDRFLTAIRQENPRTSELLEERITDNELRLTLGDWRKIYDLAKYFSQIADTNEDHVSGNVREPNASKDSPCVQNQSYIKVSVENKKDSENLSAMKWLNEGETNASMTDVERQIITDNKVDSIMVHQSIDSKVDGANYKKSSERSSSSQRTKNEPQDKRLHQKAIKKQDSVKGKSNKQIRGKRSGTSTRDTSMEQSKQAPQQNDSKKSLVTSRCIRKKCPSIPSESAKEKKAKVVADVATQVESSREEKWTICTDTSSLSKDNVSKTTEECITYSTSTSAETVSDFTHDNVPCKKESRIDSKSSEDRSQESSRAKDTAEKATESQPIHYMDKSTSLSLKKVDYEKENIDTCCETEQSSRVQEEDKGPIKNTAKSVSVQCSADQNRCSTEESVGVKSPVKSVPQASYKTKAKPDEGDALVNSDKQKSSGDRSKASDRLQARESASSPEVKDGCQRNCLRDEKCKMFCDDDDNSRKRSKQPAIVSCDKSYQSCCEPLEASNNSQHKKDQPTEPAASANQERIKTLSWKNINSKDEKTANSKEKILNGPKVSNDIQKKDSQVFQCSKDCTNDETCVFVCSPFYSSSPFDNHSVPPDPDYKRCRQSELSKQEEERKLMTELRDARENIKAEQDKERKAMAKLSDLKKHRISQEEQYSRNAVMKGAQENKELSASQKKNPSELTVIFARTEDERENQEIRISSIVPDTKSPSQGPDNVPAEQRRRLTVPINHISPSFDTPKNVHGEEGEHVEYMNENAALGATSLNRRLTSQRNQHNPSFSYSAQRRRRTVEAEHFEMPLSKPDNENDDIKPEEWPNKKKETKTVSRSENIAKRFDKTQRGMDSNVRFALVSTEKPFSTMKELEHLFDCCTLEDQPDKRAEGCKFLESLKYNEVFHDCVHESISDKIHERDCSVRKQTVYEKPEIIDHFLGRRKLEDVKVESNERRFSSENLEKLEKYSNLYIDSTYRRSNMLDHLEFCMVPSDAHEFQTLRNFKENQFETISGCPLELNEASSATCSEGELYMPSSCSYSFGEVRVSSNCRAGRKLFNRADAMTIFVTSSALPSSNESSLGCDSLGEIPKIN